MKKDRYRMLNIEGVAGKGCYGGLRVSKGDCGDIKRWKGGVKEVRGIVAPRGGSVRRWMRAWLIFHPFPVTE